MAPEMQLKVLNSEAAVKSPRSSCRWSAACFRRCRVKVFADGKRVIPEIADGIAKTCVMGASQEPRTLADHTVVEVSMAVFADAECAITESADDTAEICVMGAGQEPRMLL